MNINNYGFQDSSFLIKNNKIIKKAKSNKGIEKINREIMFYTYIKKNNIKFPIPLIYNLKINDFIEMEYLKDYNTLLNDFYINPNLLIKEIKLKLDIIHNNKIIVTKDKYKECLNIEIYDKVINRFNETKWNKLKNFNLIQKVNNIQIKNINYYLKIISEKILNIIEDKKEYYFSIIHGDIHLGNILKKKNTLCFIDPRGIFGNSLLYGIKEYDYAKLLFGISGYSIFDNMKIEELDIENNNINILFIEEYYKYFNLDIFDEFTKLLSLTIWLSNNSSFININKRITSLMIAMYFCEKYLCK